MSAKAMDKAYNSRHRKVRKARGSAKEEWCVWDSQARHIADEWAQVHGTNGEDPEHYQPMCRKHHARYDTGHSQEVSHFRDTLPKRNFYNAKILEKMFAAR